MRNLRKKFLKPMKNLRRNNRSTYLQRIVIVFLLSIVFLAGCGGVDYKAKLAAIRPNMSKDELLLIMKEYGVVRSSEIRKDGELVEVLDYTITVDVIEGDTVRFYFKFIDDRLVKWGK